MVSIIDRTLAARAARTRPGFKALLKGFKVI